MRIMKRLSILFLLLASIQGASALYTFRSAVERIGPGPHGLDSAKQFTRFTYVASARVKFSRPARGFYEYISESLQNFEFRGLYQSEYFSDSHDGYRSVLIRGENRQGNYFVDLLKGSFKSVRLPELGNLASEFSLREHHNKNVDEDTYLVRSRNRLALKQFSQDTVTEFSTGLLQISDPANIHALPGGDSLVFRNLKGEQKKIVNQFAREFPEFSKFLDRYAYTHTLLKIKSKGSIEYTEYDILSKVRQKNLQSDYPHLHEYLDRIDDTLVSHVEIKNPKKATLIRIDIDSKKQFIRARFLTQNGRVVPSYKNEPDFSQAFYLHEVKELPYTISIQSKVNIYGLKVYLDKIQIDSKFTNRDRRGKLHFKVAAIQKPRVKGRFMGVLPPSLIDIGIPDNIEILAGKVIQTVLTAHDGAGSQLNIEVDTVKPSEVMLHANLKSEAIDNRFIRFGAKFWLKKVLPEDKAIQELQALTGRGAEYTLKDLESW